jgi:hypothetical protein
VGYGGEEVGLSGLPRLTQGYRRLAEEFAESGCGDRRGWRCIRPS